MIVSVSVNFTHPTACEDRICSERSISASDLLNFSARSRAAHGLPSCCPFDVNQPFLGRDCWEQAPTSIAQIP